MASASGLIAEEIKYKLSSLSGIYARTMNFQEVATNSNTPARPDIQQDFIRRAVAVTKDNNLKFSHTREIWST